MALDARTRSPIYEKLSPILGERDANVLRSEFPSLEADELVTKRFLRAEVAEVRSEMTVLRLEIAERFQRQTACLAGTVLGSAALVIASVPPLS